MRDHLAGYPLKDADWDLASAATDEEFCAAARACGFAGYCYTQLTDVQQEVNGLLTAERKPKADMQKLKKIFGPENK